MNCTVSDKWNLYFRVSDTSVSTQMKVSSAGRFYSSIQLELRNMDSSFKGGLYF